MRIADATVFGAAVSCGVEAVAQLATMIERFASRLFFEQMD